MRGAFPLIFALALVLPSIIGAELTRAKLTGPESAWAMSPQPTMSYYQLRLQPSPSPKEFAELAPLLSQAIWLDLDRVILGPLATHPKAWPEVALSAQKLEGNPSELKRQAYHLRFFRSPKGKVAPWSNLPHSFTLLGEQEALLVLASPASPEELSEEIKDHFQGPKLKLQALPDPRVPQLRGLIQEFILNSFLPLKAEELQALLGRFGSFSSKRLHDKAYLIRFEEKVEAQQIQAMLPLGKFRSIQKNRTYQLGTTSSAAKQAEK